jgi:hypothetical protein
MPSTRTAGCSSHSRRHPSGGAHSGLTVLTGGVWLPVWVASSLLKRRKTAQQAAYQPRHRSMNAAPDSSPDSSPAAVQSTSPRRRAETA